MTPGPDGGQRVGMARGEAAAGLSHVIWGFGFSGVLEVVIASISVRACEYFNAAILLGEKS